MHIFISYAKLDTRALAFKLRDALNALPDVTAWMDESLEPGESWALQIQQEINAADYVIVLLSPDVNRPVVNKQRRSFVLNEIDYAQQLDKPIIPIMAVTTVVPVQIAGIQYIDFTGDHDTGMNRLIHKIAPRAGIPLADIPSTPVSGVKLETSLPSRPFYGRAAIIIGIVALVIIIVGAVILPGLNPSHSAITPTTNLVFSASDTPIPTQPPATSTPTIAATSAPTLTAVPSLEIADIVGTLDAQATIEQATKNVQATAAARATAYAIGTESVLNQTATAILWTSTPTPNVTASIEAYRTQQAATETSQFIQGQTATAALWTDTPTPTPPGYSPVTQNPDWHPYYQTFDGIEMALVPVGCFMMGSTDRRDDEKPVNPQCFDQPFWVSRYEITNAEWSQAVKAGAVGLPDGDGLTWYNDSSKSNWPVVGITWFQARDFAAWIGGRLPTEAEWEYAARGPSNFVYPWGNDFVADNLVFYDNSGGHPADIGSRIAGNSWVGASDLSGNVWEWVSSIYQPYPYKADDGRELNSDSTDVSRVLRGGSWFNYQVSARSAFRGLILPDDSSDFNGFRLVRPPSKP